MLDSDHQAAVERKGQANIGRHTRNPKCIASYGEEQNGKIRKKEEPIEIGSPAANIIKGKTKTTR